ncbi:MAG: glycosyltransferase family 2 protein [Chitinivibrionales bacterium]|nr:glycosyltransferase family 2 protein [Chitinivibrionales bacterium]
METWYSVLAHALSGYNSTILYYLLTINGISVFFLFVSVLELFKFRRMKALVDPESIMQSADSPAISIISPAYNEEQTIIEATHSLLNLRYPRFEVIVVNDGSKDKTIDKLRAEFELVRLDFFYNPAIPTKKVKNIFKSPLHPNLTVVDKENGGKADALNTGINLSRHELFCAIDADSLLEEDALLKAVYPFIRWKGNVAVSSGIIRIVNGCTISKGHVESVQLPLKLLPLFQIVEYLRVFLVGRFAWNALNFVLIVSGAFGLFKKSAVLKVNGYSTNTVGEDMELVVKLHRQMLADKNHQKILFLPDPVCWTEAPQTWRVLRRQRDRWLRGLLETLWKHKTMILNPRYGTIGFIAIPFMILTEVLGPLIELSGYVSYGLAYFLGLMQTEFLVLFLIVALLFGLLQSICGLLIEEVLFRRYTKVRDIILLIGIAVIENFGYRQFNFVVRLVACINFLTGKKGWGKMTRAGFTQQKSVKR